jgi:hypothetical protein
MDITNLLKLIWSKIDRPNSMCPDIEIGYVRQVLGEAMAAEIKDQGVIAEESYQWVLGQLLVSPSSESSLANIWYETNRVYVEQIQPPNDNYEDEGYLKAINDKFESEDLERARRSEEVAVALDYLIKRGLITRMNDGCYGNYTKYFGDLKAYQMMVGKFHSF